MILRLYGVAEDHWSYIEPFYPGVDLISMPIYRFLNYIWNWAAQHVPQDKFEMWVMEMEAPIPGMERQVSQTDLEAEGDSFMAAMALQKG